MKMSETTHNPSKQKFNEYIDNTHFAENIKNTIYKMIEICQSSKKENDVIIAFEDFTEVIEHGEEMMFGIGKSNDGSMSEAINLAIQNASLSMSTLDRVAGFLIHFTVHPNQSFLNIAEAMDIIHENTHDEAAMVWGVTTDEFLGKNDIKVAILFTGFGQAISCRTKAVNNLNFRPT